VQGFCFTVFSPMTSQTSQEQTRNTFIENIAERALATHSSDANDDTINWLVDHPILEVQELSSDLSEQNIGLRAFDASQESASPAQNLASTPTPTSASASASTAAYVLPAGRMYRYVETEENQTVYNGVPMAFWSISTHSLVAFNDGFLQLFECTLQSVPKMRWDTFGFPAPPTVVDSTLIQPVNESLEMLRQMISAVAGGAVAQMSSDFLLCTATGAVKLANITLLTIGAELVWICQPTRSSISFDQYRHNATASSNAETTATATLGTSGQWERQLVEVATSRSKRRPWDHAITNFQLKAVPPVAVDPPQLPPNRRSRASFPG